jgi:quinoprotein glucose dehydrogenase
MPPIDVSASDLPALIAFLATPSAPGGGAAGSVMSDGPIVASGGAPAGRVRPTMQEKYMVGPEYPRGSVGAELRYYTGYNTFPLIMKPPYATLTAYDLNSGTIKWQVPAGGDDARAVAEGATNTGFMRQRTGIITTSTGLLFQAGGDANLRVYDTTSGALLRTLPLPAGSIGLSSMYEANGRQFLVVNATAAASPAVGTLSGARGYVAFGVPVPSR